MSNCRAFNTWARNLELKMRGPSSLTMQRMLRGLFALGLLLFALPAAPIFAATDADSAAVQDVIQRSNDEQVQAIASHDSSVMADTATADHLQELTQINQDLLDNGVSSINLVRLEWGAV